MLPVAIVVMVCATLAQHLGLSEAISEVFAKVAKCPMCLSFWSTAAVLWFHGCDVAAIAAVSILMAYLSNYVGLLLILLQEVYLWLRRKVERQSRKPGK